MDFARESLLHRVPGAHKNERSNKLPANTGGWDNLNLMLFQRHDAEIVLSNVTSTPCLQGNCLETYQENIHNGVEGYNLSEITEFIFIALHLMKLPNFFKSVIPPKRLRIVASVS